MKLSNTITVYISLWWEGGKYVRALTSSLDYWKYASRKAFFVRKYIGLIETERERERYDT